MWHLLQMEPTMLTELIKQGPLIGVLSVGLWIFYKKDELRRTNDMAERAMLMERIEKQEQRIEHYLQHDALTMQELIKESTTAKEKQTTVMTKANEVMTCLIREMQEFKKSEMYLQHERARKTFNHDTTS
jgi:hypothetical protein